MTFDFRRAHHAICQVTGRMATSWNRFTPDTLKDWANTLERVASEMKKQAEIMIKKDGDRK